MLARLARLATEDLELRPMLQRVTDALYKFIVDEPKMALTGSSERGGEPGYFSHCLPLRRDVKATTGVVTEPRSLVIEEAENRLHVQKAVMRRLVDAKGGSS